MFQYILSFSIVFKITGTDILRGSVILKKKIIQSEVSQKEKHQYSILTHIYGI